MVRIKTLIFQLFSLDDFYSLVAAALLFVANTFFDLISRPLIGRNLNQSESRINFKIYPHDKPPIVTEIMVGKPLTKDLINSFSRILNISLNWPEGFRHVRS